jgi:hypothetical protein
MSAVTKKLGRADARKAAEAALRAKTAHIKHSSPVQAPNPDLGREIFVYHHLQTNQTVYSLTKGLNVRLKLSTLLPFILFFPLGRMSLFEA